MGELLSQPAHGAAAAGTSSKTLTRKEPVAAVLKKEHALARATPERMLQDDNIDRVEAAVGTHSPS